MILAVIGERLGRDRDFDAALGGELDGVGEKVRDALAHARGIVAEALREVAVVADEEFEALVFGRRLEQLARALHGVQEVAGHSGDFQLAGFDLGEIEHVVQQRHQRLAAIEDDVDLFLLRARQVFAFERLRHAEHAVEGRADLVAHVGEELRLGAGGRFGRFLRRAEFFLDQLPGGDVDDGADQLAAVKALAAITWARSCIQRQPPGQCARGAPASSHRCGLPSPPSAS
jgi:hypothetical protein